MRKLLDKMFQNKKFSIVAPIIVACVVYFLFLLFGDNADLKIVTPIACVFWFFGEFLVLFIQVKNPLCPGWFLDFFELLIVVALGVYSVIAIISFIISGFKDFDLIACVGMVGISSVSFAHSKRTK